MKNTKLILRKLLHPSKVFLYLFSPVVFATLIFIFVTGKKESGQAYLIYCMSAYSLVILLVDIPRTFKKIKKKFSDSRLMQRISSTEIGGRYLSDPHFRGGLNIYQGLIVNLLYALFRAVTGIRYMSIWLISMAVYYLVLAGMRSYLIWGYRHKDKLGISYEYRCYRKVALMLFLLNIPMGGMIVLMVMTNSGFSYPGYVIYLSALYTFYTMLISVVNIVKYRKVGSPILSAAKILNFVCAMMSVLGLQTAMISRFSTNGEGYRKLMNAITGGFVYGIVIIIAIFMVLRSVKTKKKVIDCEQI